MDSQDQSRRKQGKDQEEPFALGTGRIHIQLDDESAQSDKMFEKLIQFEAADSERAMYFDPYNRY